MPIQTQREVGDYVVLRELTLGGETFLVEHKYMKRLYLLKLLPEELGTDTSTMQRIQTDFGLLSTVEHPAIVKLHTISYDQGRYFLIMDAVLDESGQMTTLRSHLQSGRGRFSEGDLHHMLFQIGSALDALHGVQREGKPMLHLGLKLDNILVGKGKERPKVALIDYGLASLVGDNNMLKRAFGCVDEQQEGDAGRIQFLQNFAFLSPEQRMISDVRKLTPASDTYAFGVLAYYLIAQRFPEGYFPMPSKLVEHYRWDWDGLIALCLQTDANERPLLLSSLLEKLATGGRLYDLSTRAGRYSPVQAPRDFQDDEGDGHEVSLKPVIHDGSVDRPSKDYDISNNLKVDSTVKVYQPEELDIKDVQPLRSEMVIVQGGAFNRGSHEGNRDASPRHQVRLNSFAIDIHPVTNEQFVR
ncbi:MAG: protein kinase, partial [Chlamydiia bacterium]|nr:protein kinase [Chlamydiia bacterium]